MSIWDFMGKKPKPLSKMTRQELRQQELLLEKERAGLLKKVEKLAGEKQSLFDRGAKEKTPEVRRMLAQEFEMRTSEQLMLGRQLNMRTKESMTISRLRMLRENAERNQQVKNRLGMIGEKDMMRLEKLIENDAVSSEMYQEKLDAILELGAAVDVGATGMSGAGQSVMDIWDKMDSGLITDEKEGFDEADRRVREQKSAEPAD